MQKQAECFSLCSMHVARKYYAIGSEVMLDVCRIDLFQMNSKMASECEFQHEISHIAFVQDLQWYN